MNFRYYHTAPLITIILLLSICIDYGIYKLFMPILNEYGIEFLRAPGNASLIGSILVIYDKFLWRWPVFKNLITIPDLRGRYKGIVKYEFDGQPGCTSCYVEISQTASEIKIHSYFDNSNKPRTISKSLIESIRKEDGYHYIYLYYFNYGSKLNSTLDCHEGANMLKVLPNCEGYKYILQGHYFTNRTKQTRGVIELRYESKKLKGKY